MTKPLLLMLAIATMTACGALSAGGGSDAFPMSDAPGGCIVNLGATPPQPVAGSNAIQVTAMFQNPDVYTKQWSIADAGSNVTFVPVDNMDPTQANVIAFVAPVAGEYDVTVMATEQSNGQFCSQTLMLNVGVANAQMFPYRARITPAPAGGPSQIMPPIEQTVIISGGADQAHDLAYGPPVQVTGTVTAAGVPIAAYVRMTPMQSQTFVEAYAGATGFGPVFVAQQLQNVLVVPSSPAFAPHYFPGMATFVNGQFAVDTSTAISGKVLVSGGAGLAGASVQLELGGVLPSTVATTAADGSFTVLADTSDAQLTTQVTVNVAPPASSGLPRLGATGAFSLAAASPIAVQYPALTTRNLQNLKLTQGGAPVIGASVAVVGSVASFAATVDGAAAANAIHAIATTNASGVIAVSTPVPAAPVSIVATLASGEVEVVSNVNLTAGVPASVALPAAATAGGIVTDFQGNPLGGVEVELQPAGALALAGALPVEAATGSDGSYHVALAASGVYDVQLLDFAGRGAFEPLAAQPPAAIGAFQLQQGLVVDGVVTMSGSTLSNAVVELLCSSCTGLAAAETIAESVTNVGGTYRVVVLDPNVTQAHAPPGRAAAAKARRR